MVTDVDACRSDRNEPLSLPATLECHKFGLPNNPSKKQCSSCQGWRDGLRKRCSYSAIYAMRKRKKRENQVEF